MSNEIMEVNENLMPQTLKGKYEMAGVLARSGLIPKGLDTAEKVFVALQWGHELQLSPMVAVNNIAVINGKPTLSADIMSAVVKRSPEYGGVEWIKNSDTEAECKITRILPNGKTETVTSRFSIEDAKKAGLTNKQIWQQYPRRMLKHRCLSYGLKDLFPDILAGLYTPEEMESTIEPAQQTETAPMERNVTPDYEASNIDCGEVVAEMPEVPPLETENSDRSRLSLVIQKYGEVLKKSANTPTPYKQATQALNSGDEAEISDKFLRCVTWLGKQGISVEV